MSKVFVLSLPKSGTYMWTNILKLAGYDFCGKHIAYSGYQIIPDDRERFFREPQNFYVKSPLAESLNLINDGEFAVGHLPCAPETIHLLSDFELIFSYRDLQAAVVSFINYAAKFSTNREKPWSDESLPNSNRVEQFLRTDAIDFIKLVNSVAGWKNLPAGKRLLQADYDEVVNFDPGFIRHASEFFKTGEPEMTDMIEQALNTPSFTKIANKLKDQSSWSDVSRNYYHYYGLGEINRMLGFEQVENDPGRRKIKKVAIICNPKFIYYKFVQDYLRAFEEFKDDYEIEYIPVQMMGETSTLYDFSSYSLVVVTFHIRPWLARWGNIEFESALFRYQGTKVLLLHDEYDETNALKTWIRDFKVDQVFSVIPPKYLHTVYPAEEFPGTRFHSILTAYVPSDIPDENTIPPIALRANDIVYRGRAGAPWRGELVKEKYDIGEYFKSLDQYGLRMDLDSHESERIYGEAWIQFLISARATLGTESGANVFDVDGLIRQWFESNSQDEPVSAQSIPAELNFREMNLGVKMNQISPKIFEAISCKTALILYEGEYSEILSAGIHYIELKKDHSNIDDVIAKLTDIDYLQKLVDRTYRDIISSGDYTYEPVISRIYGTNHQSTSQDPRSTGVYQKGLTFNNLANNQLAEKSALLKISNSRTHIINKRYTNYKHITDRKVSNLQTANEKLKTRIEKLKTYNSRFQAKIAELEKFKEETEDTLAWKLNQRAQELIGKVKK